MDRRDENLKNDILRAAYQASMPAKMSKRTALWVEAIALVRKADNSTAYAILKRNADLTHKYEYVNGSVARISKIEEIYPYITLEKSYIKTFKDDDDKDARVQYLNSLHLPYAAIKHFEDMDIDTLNKEVVCAAMYQQLEALKEHE